ncbi:translocation/assembly module TamB domain-containing protein [Blattabacterium cuenoti]|uniref:translocation/assembly module TamB domain-containing protein n=1 Tax=Blattabacterium cuenoti TaxID=1653831 RepID=UPI00163D28A7|nr:translocation/assembly module TamB domain-containing protein [Blattabacterium cuenoti]
MNNAFFHKLKKTRILILFLLLGLFFFSIYYRHRQEIQEKASTFFLKIFLKKIKNHLNEKIYIKNVSINFLKKELIFYDVKIIDHHRFSFIHLSKCKISIENLLYFILFNSKYLKIKDIFIDNSSFFIKKYFKEKENNILFFIKYFLMSKKLRELNINFVTCSKLIISKSYLEYNNINKSKHFFSICIKNIKIDNKKIKASVFSLQSKSKGLVKKDKFLIIENLFCNFVYHYPSKFLIYNLLIKTPNSYLKGYFTIFQYKENQILFPKINIQCQIFEGSKLGQDLGIFFYKKWNFDYKVFFRGSIHGKFNHKEKIFFLNNVFIKDLQGNKLYADQIHILYAKKKWKKIKFLKTFIQFRPHEIKKIIPYSFYYYKFKLTRFILNLKQCYIYKGDIILSLYGKKRNLEIKGIVKNRFFIVQISTYIDFFNNQYTGQISIEKKYLSLFFGKKTNIFWLSSKIQPFIYNKLLNLYIMNFKGNLYNFFVTLLFSNSHSGYKMYFTGKIFSHFQKICINVYDKNKKNIKIIFLNNKNQSFQKISINIYDMIIGHIYGCLKWKNLFKISCLKDSSKYINFDFLIKKSFFDFIKPVKNENIFSDIQISGEKRDNAFKMIFHTKKMQLNEISFDKLFVMVDYSLKKRMKIHVEKIIFKKFFSKKINISVLNQKNFWIINSNFFFKLKKQEYKEQILNFFCKKKGNFLMCYPFLSKLNINGYDWLTDYNYHNLGIIKIDLIHKKYIIDNIILFSDSKKQKIVINTNYVKNKQKIFQFYLENVQLKKIILNKNLNINGFANGFFLCKNISNQIEPNINIIIKNFSIEKTILGNFYIFSFQKKKKNYEINGIIKKDSENILKIFGNIRNESKNQSKLNLDIMIQNFKIDNFSSFWKKMNLEVRGTLTGKIQIFGSLYDLHYFGKVEIKKFGIKINSSNTNYEIKNTAYIDIFSKSCILSNSCFVDTKYNTKGYINGFFSHKNLIQWRLIKLSINTKNLLVLDSYEKQNNFLFGKIFTHGKIQIIKKENTNKICISMNNGKILNTSYLYINPLKYNKKDISKLNNLKRKKENHYSLLIDIKTIINENTKVSIFLDKNHFIQLRGGGFLFIEKKYEKNVQTSGTFFVKDGLYHYYNNEKIPIKLERKFKIKPGGFITWKNDFYQSNINLIAYDTKYVFNYIEYIDFIKKSQYDKNMVFTELRIHIFGKIQKPNINIEILLPESKEDLQKKLSEKLNSFEEKTMQFISILILGKFFLKNDIIKNFLYFSIYEIFLKKLKHILL